MWKECPRGGEWKKKGCIVGRMMKRISCCVQVWERRGQFIKIIHDLPEVVAHL